MSPTDRYTKRIVEERGWTLGTSVENEAALFLSAVHWRTRICQQFPIGRYRLDFAWPDLKIALEIDGWHHRSPEGAQRDARRDAKLRADGWLTFRVDDQVGLTAMKEQIVRVCKIVHALSV